MAMKIACSVVVVNDAGEILLVREGDVRVHGKYNLPGGHSEDGESALDCARRELREETGLDLVPSGLLGVYRQGGRDQLCVCRACVGGSGGSAWVRRHSVVRMAIGGPYSESFP
ncbi:MAG: NUDIX hydrolase [bacterium]|nr:NUDIX hydrolase [bacterium]